MKIDITIYDDNDDMMMGYYNEQADVDSLTDCAFTLSKIAISEIRKAKCDKTRQNETD